MSAKWSKGTAGPAGDEHHNLIPVPAVTHSLRGEGFDASEDGTGRGVPLVVDTLTSNGDAHSGFRDEKGLVAVAVALRGRDGGATIELGDDQAFALRASSGGGDKPHVLVPLAFDTTQITSAANRSNPQPGDACHPIAAGAHPPAIVLPISDQATRHAGTDGSGGSAGKGHGFGVGGETDPMYTLTKSDKHAIAIQAAQTAMHVRHMTPRECERLQGFPDDYTQIPNPRIKNVRPEKLDDYYIKYQMRGGQKTRDEVIRSYADGPRYKALGNSWAVPCARWVGERIDAVNTITNKEPRNG